MTELLWALVALILLSVLILLGLTNRRAGLHSSGFSSLDELMEGGLFMLAFFVLAAPLLLLWTLGEAIWKKYHPPVVLPVEGDDPLWGRNVNRKLVERAFLAVQGALSARDPALAQPFLSQTLGDDLRAECERLAAQPPVAPRGQVQLEEIDVRNERIHDCKLSSGKHIVTYYLDANVRGTRGACPGDQTDGQPSAGPADVRKVEMKLEFGRAPGNDQPWRLLTYPELPSRKLTGKRLQVAGPTNKRQPKPKGAKQQKSQAVDVEHGRGPYREG